MKSNISKLVILLAVITAYPINNSQAEDILVCAQGVACTEDGQPKDVNTSNPCYADWTNVCQAEAAYKAEAQCIERESKKDNQLKKLKRKLKKLRKNK